MILRAAMLLSALSCPAAAQGFTPLVCLFTPQCAADEGCAPTPFTIEIAPIDHEPGLWFAYGGTVVSVRDVTPEAAPLQTFITNGHVDREIISVFVTGEAIHTRHFQRPGRGPDVTNAIGQCEVL